MHTSTVTSTILCAKCNYLIYSFWKVLRIRHFSSCQQSCLMCMLLLCFQLTWEQMFFTIRAFVRDCTRSSPVCRPSWNQSACWSEKECTVYWPQFCGSVVSNFTARFLSALTIMDGTAMREQGHLAAEPQSAALSWQAWWMQADEYTLALLQPGASLCLWGETRNAVL